MLITWKSLGDERTERLLRRLMSELYYIRMNRRTVRQLSKVEFNVLRGLNGGEA